MFLLLPCATVKDSVTLPVMGDIAKIATDMNKSRQTIKQYSNVQYLLKRIQEGEVIMTRKVQFDNYLKSQVDLMKAYVYGSYPCQFQYAGYMDSESTISTVGLSTKEQWAIEMVMSRYNINSIYHAAAYSSLQYIFKQTNSSYQKNYKNSAKLITNLQIAYKYFNQGYQPLKRLGQVYSTLQQLFSKNNKEIIDGIIQVRKQIFISISVLIACNLAYLKLEKYRLMTEYKSCKQLAFSVYNLIKDTKTLLTKSGLINKVHPDVKVFMDIGELFFLGYCLYFLLQEHQDMKNKQQYGFIKKQFQQMIVQNCVVCEQFIKIAQKISKFPGKDSLDNVIFADGLFQQLLIDVKKKQYAYGINIHENKEIKVPTLDEVLVVRVGSRSIWTSIQQF